ncbi:hypothetical protein PV325_005950 [Microctonus aethiopoides]|nr:hypothetical protein PV325_005950 [Microctonus aethiopoides]
MLLAPSYCGLTGKSSRDDGEYLAAACLSLRKSITGSSVALSVSNVRRESTYMLRKVRLSGFTKAGADKWNDREKNDRV